MLNNTLMADLKVAMLEKNKLKKDIIQLLRNGLLNAEKEKGAALSEDEEIVIVKRELKQTRDSLDMFEKGGRADLVEKEEAKIAILESYLPTMMTEEQIRELLVSMNIDKGANMGQVIGQVIAQVKNNAEGKIVSKVVREYLNS